MDAALKVVPVVMTGLLTLSASEPLPAPPKVDVLAAMMAAFRPQNRHQRRWVGRKARRTR